MNYHRLSVFATSALILIATASIAAQPKTVGAIHTDKPPLLDGKLDDACWQHEPPINGFSNQESGAKANAQTTMRVVWDERAIYFGIRCEDEAAAGLVGLQNRYDGDMSQEDYVELDLDSLRDRRSYYVFRVNVMGTKYDGRVSGSIRPETSWDGEWQAAVRKEDGAWCAEIAIPFSTVRLRSTPEQEWGVNLLRYRRATDELSTWSPVGTATWDASKFGVINGIKIDPRSFLHTEWSGYSSFTKSFAGGPLHLSARQGLDVNHPFTPNWNAYLTAKPDFSQVESELVGITLSDLEVRTTEKRPFFQEGSDLFPRTGLPLFYTKRIGEMDGGLRMQGAMGRNQFYFLDAQAAAPARANHQVFKLINTLNRQGSNLGFIYVGKESGGLNFMRSWGMDLRYILPYHVRLHAAYSAVHNARYASKADGWSASLYRNEFPWTLYILYQDLGNNLRDGAEDGFITLDGIRGPRGYARYYWKDPVRGVQRASAEFDGQYANDRAGSLRRSSATLAGHIDFKNKWTLTGIVDRLESNVDRPALLTFKDLRGGIISYNVLQAIDKASDAGPWLVPSGSQYPAYLFGAMTGHVEGSHGVFYVGAGAYELQTGVRFLVQGERSPKVTRGEHEFSVRPSLILDVSSKLALTVAYRREQGSKNNAYTRLRYSIARDRTLYVVYGEQETFNPTTGKFEQMTRTANRLFVKMAFAL